MALEHGTEIYPEQIYRVDWGDHVPRRDVLHLGALQRACIVHRESAISWEFGLQDTNSSVPRSRALINQTSATDEDKQALLETLRRCPVIDVYIPTALRGQGYCEDTAAYTKYLQARMIPHWVLEIKLFDKELQRDITYHELCPHTPILVFNHYWDDIRSDSAWPPSKPLYLMPNIEMYELEAKHYRQVDVILCKTVLCAEYLAKWFRQEGNPRMTRVLYHRFTSSDVATNALVESGQEERDGLWHEREKDFSSVAFTHTAGSSTWKGTQFVIDCWTSRPDLPLLNVYTMGGLGKQHEDAISKCENIKLHKGYLDSVAFGTMIARSSVFVCASIMEGYGRYINHARASGGLVITTDIPPMNELVTPSSGVMMQRRGIQ